MSLPTAQPILELQWIRLDAASVTINSFSAQQSGLFVKYFFFLVNGSSILFIFVRVGIQNLFLARKSPAFYL